MFKIYISESAYDRIISAEEQKTMAVRSNLYKLLKLQPVRFGEWMEKCIAIRNRLIK